MPQIDVVPNMTKAPGRCVCCNTTPTDPHSGQPKPAIDLNVDVDWGNNAYLCNECVDVICDLWGRVDEEEHKLVLSDNRSLRKDLARLRTKFKEAVRDRDKLAAGRKVETKLKKRKRSKS